MDKIKITFTAVFRPDCDFAFSTDSFINCNDSRFEDAEIKAYMDAVKDTRVISFEAKGYFSDCAAAARIFLVNLVQAIYADDTYTYMAVHDFLYPFVKIINEPIQFQSVHKSVFSVIVANAGLEIEALNDMRLSSAVRVLAPNDHYGNMFRQCPNCQDFEIPESKKLGKHLNRCPCCGLNLICWE